MIVLNLQSRPPPPPPTPPLSSTRVIAFTTPKNYAARLSRLIHSKGWTPLWCPTVAVETTPQTISATQHLLSSPLEDFSAIAFTSRTGITAVSDAIAEVNTPLLSPHGEEFVLSALGEDSKLLDESFMGKLCENPNRIRVLVPPVATPTSLVESMGVGEGRKVLCPVPVVVGLEEPPVVPKFLADLGRKGWIPVRLNAYETRWAGVESGVKLVEKSEEEGGLDAIVFTSSGEVEGLLKSLGELGFSWGMVRQRCPRMVVAAHGPVTAAGAEAFGVGVDVVSSRFDSFSGVVDALDYRFQSFDSL